MFIKKKDSVFSPLTARLKVFMKKRFNAWLTRRIPQGSQQRINHRNIFIVPTRFGASLMFFMLLLFLLGTNYQNNVIILISYLLVSFFIVVMHHSFYNLSGLQFNASTSLQGFVGSQLYLPIVITSNKARFNINFSFDQPTPLTDENSIEHSSALDYKTTPATLHELVAGENHIRVPYHVATRGEYSLGRVLIVSEYGFGLFRSWTRLDFGQQVTAYPKPVSYDWSDTQKNAAGEQDKDRIESYQDSFQPGQDEFHQLQHYQLGEPISRVAWKQVARGQGWFTKQYQQALSGKLTLDFDLLPSGTLEQRLSLLSFAIQDCSQQQIAFSLKLPNQVIEYDNSAQHTLRCLAALARY